MDLETLGAPTLRKGSARTPGQVLLTPEEGGDCAGVTEHLQQGWTRVFRPCGIPIFCRSAPRACELPPRPGDFWGGTQENLFGHSWDSIPRVQTLWSGFMRPHDRRAERLQRPESHPAVSGPLCPPAKWSPVASNQPCRVPAGLRTTRMWWNTGFPESHSPSRPSSRTVARAGAGGC